jgi:hypothetical protein
MNYDTFFATALSRLRNEQRYRVYSTTPDVLTKHTTQDRRHLAATGCAS